MKPELRVDFLTGETVVTWQGKEYQSKKHPIIIRNYQEGYIIFPEAMAESIPNHIRKVIIKWEKI